MPYVGDKQAVLYKGDYQPAALYKGGQMVAGYDEQTYTGTEIAVADTYNDFADVTAIGKAKQTQTVQGKNLCPTDWSKWTLSGGAYIDEEGYCVIGSSTAQASVSFNFAKKANTRDLYISLVSEKLPDSLSDKNAWFCSYRYYLNDEYCGDAGMAELIGDRPTRRLEGSTATKDCNIVQLTMGIGKQYTPFYRFKEVSVTDYQYNLPASWFEPFVPNSPSPDYPSPIELASGTVLTEGRNLFNISNFSVFGSQYCNVAVSGSAIIFQHDKTDEYTGAWYFAVFSLPNLKVNETYTYSDLCHYADPWNTNTSPRCPISFYKQDGSRISYISRLHNSKTSFTVPDECATVTVQYTLNNDWRIPLPVSNTLTVTNVQVQLGPIATPYEPYHAPTSLTVPSLFGMDGVYDTFENRVLVDGVWRSRHTQRWGEKVFDGSEKWSAYYKTLYIPDMTVVKGSRKMCNICEWKDDFTARFQTGSEQLISISNQYNGYVFFCWDEMLVDGTPSVAKWKDFLSQKTAEGIQVTFYEQLAEPIVTLGDPQPLSSYPHYTKLSVAGDYPPDITAQIKTIQR